VVVDVAVRGVDLAEGLAAVGGDPGEDVDRVDGVHVVRIARQLVPVVATGVVVGASFPALAPVGGTEQAALVLGGVEDAVDHVGVDGRDAQAHAAAVHLRQALVDGPPGLATVGGLVERGFGAAVDQGPDVAAALVGGGVDEIRVAGVEPHLGESGVVGDVEDALPGCAAVGGLVDTAVAAGSPQGPHGRDVDDVGVLRMHLDAADVLGFTEPHVLPRLAAVHALVDAVAERHRALGVVLPGANPDRIGVRRIDGHAADGVRALRVEDRLPRRSGVVGLPQTARRGGHEVPVPLARRDGEVDHTPRVDGRTDVPQSQSGQGVGRQPVLGVVLGGDLGEREAGQREQNRQQDATGVLHGDLLAGGHRLDHAADETRDDCRGACRCSRSHTTATVGRFLT
jgi:hypothetical protein